MRVKYCVLNVLLSMVFSLSAWAVPEQIIDWDSQWNLPREGKFVNDNGQTLLSIQVAPGKERQVVAGRPFDLTPYLGHQIELIYEVKIQNVSKPPEPWNGLKLMLHYFRGNKECWSNVAMGKTTGTYDWTSVAVPVFLPLNSRDGELLLGLQNSSGTAEIRSIKIKDCGKRNVFVAPFQLPDNFKAEYTSRVTEQKPLRGVMSANYQPGSYKKEDIAALSGWNANLIRWQLQPDGWARDNACLNIPAFRQWLRGKIDQLEPVLADCQSLGLKVIIDMHGAPGARRGNKFVSSEHDLINLELRMLFEKDYADAFVECWQEIARRFKDNPAIWGYDLINEPHQSESSDNVRESYLAIQYRAAKAIREIDPQVPIIVESNCWDGPWSFEYLQPLPLSNIIYQVHMYSPGMYTHQGIENPPAFAKGSLAKVQYPGMIGGLEWNREQLKKELAPVRAFQLKYGVRIYCGEFSVVRWAPNGAQYLDDVINIFEEYGWDWSYHAFREWDGWSVEHSSDVSDKKPASQDTDRKKILLKYFERNRK